MEGAVDTLPVSTAVVDAAVGRVVVLALPTLMEAGDVVEDVVEDVKMVLEPRGVVVEVEAFPTGSAWAVTRRTPP